MSHHNAESIHDDHTSSGIDGPARAVEELRKDHLVQSWQHEYKQIRLQQTTVSKSQQ